MDWIQVFTIIGVIVAVLAWMFNKLDSDIKGLGTRLDGHAQRIDQLYRMFIDLLKERK